jgi:uncharacterized protein (TIGR00645 family)
VSGAGGKSRAERQFERVIFASRWLSAPFFAGLVAMLAMLLYKFALDLFAAFMKLPGMTDKDVVLTALKLIDLTLVANLLLIVAIAGYENFVSRIDTIDERDRSEWMGTVDFGAMKTKLVGSIIAIASIYLLALALDIGSANRGDVLWTLIVQGGLVVSGLALAAMDWIAGHRKG